MEDKVEVRGDFPILEKKINGYPLIYFDSAATTQKPFSVVEAMTRFYLEDYGTVHRAVYSLAAKSTQKHSAVREKVRKFLNAKTSDEIVFTRGTTDGMNLLASTIGSAFINEGDEVLLAQTEHHASVVPWQRAAEIRGAKIKIIPINEQGELLIDALKELLASGRVKVVSLAHITNSTGTVYPIQDVVRLAHEVGAYVIVDAAQSAAHLSIDVQKLDVDFLIFSGHKIYGPTGIGILYGKRELLEKLPPYQMGGDMIETVSFEKTTFQKPPLRFEAGTPPIAEIIGLGAAIDYLENIGMDKIARWEEMLLSYATEKLKTISGLKIIGSAQKKGAIISFVVQGVHPLDIGTMLDCKGIAIRTGHLCTQVTLSFYQVPSFCRISFGVYNTPEEIDQFVCHLQDILKLLK